MGNFKKIIKELVLPFLVSWFLITLIVDIIAVPAAFRNCSVQREAGKIGLTVFGTFNYLEIIFGISIFVSYLNFFTTKIYEKIMSGILLVLPFIYVGILTPGIKYYADMMHDSTSFGSEAYQRLKMAHHQYHVLYKYIDSGKLIILLTLIILFIKNKISNVEEKA